jgi:hypothetical protein
VEAVEELANKDVKPKPPRRRSCYHCANQMVCRLHGHVIHAASAGWFSSRERSAAAERSADQLLSCIASQCKYFRPPADNKPWKESNNG